MDLPSLVKLISESVTEMMGWDKEKVNYMREGDADLKFAILGMGRERRARG
nr:hypothetical protein Q903MT_gene4879 [Picea sitchensis]